MKAAYLTNWLSIFYKIKPLFALSFSFQNNQSFKYLFLNTIKFHLSKMIVNRFPWRICFFHLSPLNTCIIEPKMAFITVRKLCLDFLCLPSIFSIICHSSDCPMRIGQRHEVLSHYLIILVNYKITDSFLITNTNFARHYLRIIILEH
jgi:hypothetical protein